MKRRIGIDVGGTKCLGVVVSDDGALLDEMKVPTPLGVEALIEAIVDMVHRLGGTEQLGVGLPGLVTRHGVLRAAPNLPGVVEAPVAALLQQRLGPSVSVSVDNDATCAALAEWHLGAGRGVHDMVLVTLGTGIGGGVVMGGNLQRGGHGFAGEIGHMTMVADGRACGCGRRGCWERYASGSALADHARVITGTATRGEDVIAAAGDGQSWAIEVVEVWAGWVAAGLANLANVVDPQRFVIGGGLAEAAAVILGPITTAYPQHLYAAEHRDLAEIAAGACGPRAGALGAALLGEGGSAVFAGVSGVVGP